ncbi:MAG: hypothetical protein ACKV2T_05715 [Kofleriaceae bacterium]
MHWFVIMVALAGCLRDEAADRALAADVQTVHANMHARFAAADAARRALESGDLAKVRAVAGIIGGLTDPEILPEWRPAFAKLRSAAAELGAAADPMAAAHALAALGARCGDCHRAMHARLPTRTRAPTPRGGSLSAVMAVHASAAEQMWNGLVASTESEWQAGAVALERAPMAIVAEGEVPGHTLGIAADVERVHQLARRAQRATTPEARMEIYGDLLATCAACHHTIRDR